MTDDSREPNSSTLAAFLSGEASASDSAEVLRWSRSSPANAARLDALRKAWDDFTRPTPSEAGLFASDEIWNRIASHLDDERPPLRLVAGGREVHARRAPHFATTTRGTNAPWIVAAACVVLFVSLYAEHRVESAHAQQRVAASDDVREYRTVAGQRASGTLPDGSAFQLGPLSVLRVLSGYDAPERVVELEGDGYFNVTHDARHPFSVRTARSTIHDIGTRFIVRARPTETRLEVAVADGKVAIDSLTVNAGQAARVDASGTVALLSHPAIDARFAWTRGEFVFDHVLVPDVLGELSRWYGDTFVLADSSLRTVRLTTVLRGETLLEALLVLETALAVDAHVSGDTVTLTRHANDKPSPR
jgi:transmembrane sensor